MGLLAGCSADDDFRVDPPRSTDGTTLQLLIPNTTLARDHGTRAGSTLTRSENESTASLAEHEGEFSSLSLVGFYYDNEESGKPAKKHFYITLDPEGADTSVEGIYNCYNLKIEDGSYRLYLIANVDLSGLANISNQSATSAETIALENDIKNMRFLDKTGLENVDLPKPGNLPMAWTQGISVKKGELNRATASLEFCVAKVRVTLLYDNTDFSAGYAPERLTVSATDAINVYGSSPLFKPETYTSDNYKVTSLLEKVAEGQHRSFAGVDLEKLTVATGDDYQSLDNLAELADTDNKIAYQVVAYLPECVAGMYPNEDAKTKLNIKAQSQIGNFDIPLGCMLDGSGKGDFARGHYYDVVGLVKAAGDVDFKWSVQPWTAETLSINLSGDTELNLGETVIKKIDGSTPQTINYATTAPRLTFESATDGGKPIFLCTADPTTNQITVRVNPALGVRATSIKNTYLYVIAGNIRKKVDVEEVDLHPFLEITPAEQTVYANQVSTLEQYSLYISYATNLDKLTLTLSEYSNPNEYSNSNPNGMPKTDTALEDLKLYAEIIDNVEEENVLSKRIRLTKPNGSNVLHFETGNMLEGESFPLSGVIRITMEDPIDQNYFGQTLTGNIHGVATDASGNNAKTDDGEFTIVPSAQVYTVHFRAAKGGTTDENWKNVHVWAYQNLEAPDGNLIVKKDDDGNWTLNYVEYNFSIGAAFLGWKPWGPVTVPASTSLEDWHQVGTTENTPAYKMDWGAETDASKGYYSTGNDFFHDQRTSESCTCPTCKGGIPGGWPGIAMVKETGDNEGWWKIELPLIAKPGKTLLMFIESDNSHKERSDGNGQMRYPASQIPGVILPNFADNEAWFLLDLDMDNKNQTKQWVDAGDNCYFTDGKKESYGTAPAPTSSYTYHIEFNDQASTEKPLTPEGDVYTYTASSMTKGDTFGIRKKNTKTGAEAAWYWSNSKNASVYTITQSGTYQGTSSNNNGQNWEWRGPENKPVTFTFDPNSMKLKVEVENSTPATTYMGLVWHAIDGPSVILKTKEADSETYKTHYSVSGTKGTDGLMYAKIAVYSTDEFYSGTLGSTECVRVVDSTSAKSKIADTSLSNQLGLNECSEVWMLRTRTNDSNSKNAIFWINPLSNRNYTGIQLDGGTKTLSMKEATQMTGNTSGYFYTVDGLTSTNGGTYTLHDNNGNKSKALAYNRPNVEDQPELTWFFAANAVTKIKNGEPETAATQKNIYLVGEFNDWNQSNNKFSLSDNETYKYHLDEFSGSFKIKVEDDWYGYEYNIESGDHRTLSTNGSGDGNMTLKDGNVTDITFYYKPSTHDFWVTYTVQQTTPGKDYSNVYVNVPGDHNDWKDNGVNPAASGISKHTLTIGKGSFKIKVWDGSEHWYSTGSAIEQNKWISVSGDNNSNMTISGANDGDRFDVEWDFENNKIKVTKK